MRHVPLLFLVLLFDGASCIAFAQTAPNPKTLKVITYNVQFLPGFAGRWNRRAEPDYRAQRIAEEVAGFDIVGLQETFDTKYRRRIIDGVREKWSEGLNHVVSPMADDHITNGGCLILTRMPILKSNSTVFKHYSSPADHGLRADGFAAKGVIHARIALGGEAKASAPEPKEDDRCLVDVYVTHLEARDGGIRSRQYEELAAFIKKTSDPRLPLILMGDLNTRGMPDTAGDSPYGTLMRLLNEARPKRGVIDVWTALKGDAHGGTTEQDSEEKWQAHRLYNPRQPEGAGAPIEAGRHPGQPLPGRQSGRTFRSQRRRSRIRVEDERRNAVIPRQFSLSADLLPP